ncbi:MAG: M48 family metallopeptidase [Oculatellaceae cyanobacterium Prado106]|jgi:hypothetical protein|nr:M48 family metallopeptidase [Oculatellaceae cyanobacterium Prado106]
MTNRKVLSGLTADSYQHPADQKSLASLEKMPGLPMLLKKINEYGIDRLLRLQTMGGEFRVSDRNFPKLHRAFLETCLILDVTPLPDLYLFKGTGYIQTNAIGVEKPLVSVNLEALEWLSADELLFVLGHEVARIKGKYLTYQQMALVMPLLKNLISTTTLGFGGLAANGIEVALYNWIVMSKFTCDRAGFLACQDLDVAIAALMKLGGLPGEYLNADTLDDFVTQAREFDLSTLDNLDQMTKFFSFMEYRFPWAIMRASELLKWVDSGAYRAFTQPGSLPPESPPEPEAQEETETVVPMIEEPDERSPDPANPKTDPEDWNFLSSW